MNRVRSKVIVHEFIKGHTAVRVFLSTALSLFNLVYMCMCIYYMAALDSRGFLGVITYAHIWKASMPMYSNAQLHKSYVCSEHSHVRTYMYIYMYA